MASKFSSLRSKPPEKAEEEKKSVSSKFNFAAFTPEINSSHTESFIDTKAKKELFKEPVCNDANLI